jgi:PTH1 family peptidyl-tRNA hydrolase
MQLIVGLGNPGAQYERTRHNAGFLVIDELARRAGREVRTPEAQSLTARVRIGDRDALLVKPQTFMNLSGVAVAALQAKHGIADAPLVISDDAALPFGKLRVRPSGSAGGQNGLKSVIEKLGHQNFPRLRFGIAPDHPIKDLKRFVLEEFSRAERETLSDLVSRAADAVETILNDGIAAAMSKYN